MQRAREPSDSPAGSLANQIYYTPRLKTAKRSSADASASRRCLLSSTRSTDRSIGHAISAIQSVRPTIPEANYSGRGRRSSVSGGPVFKGAARLYGESIAGTPARRHAGRVTFR